MSEDGNLVESLGHKIRGKYYEEIGLHPGSHPEWHRNVPSEKRARQAVKQYLQMSSQEPQATFLADSESVFNLADYQQGSIIRVEQYFPLSDHPETPSYRWFVFGDRKADSVYIYDVWFTDKSTGFILPTSGDLQIFAEDAIKLHSFPIRDAIFVLTDLEKLYPDGNDREKALEKEYKMPVTKIDVMAIGKTIREKSKRRSFQKDPSLKLVTETA